MEQLDVGCRKQFYKTLNLLQSDVDGSEDSIAKVTKAHRVVIKFAHPDMGGSKEWAEQVNAAKACLLDSDQRAKYNAALAKFGLNDG